MVPMHGAGLLGLAESFSSAIKGIQQVIGTSPILLWSDRFRNLDEPLIFLACA
jgi:hypothetical protein